MRNKYKLKKLEQQKLQAKQQEKKDDENNNNNNNLPQSNENKIKNENLFIKNMPTRDIMIKKTEEKIESHTKVILNSPKDPESNGNKENYKNNTFCTFKTIDDIFYLVYIKGKDIVFFDLIDERQVINIHSYNYIVEIKYLFDEYNQRDLIIFLSNNLMLWNVNNFECLFDIDINISEMKYGIDHLGILKLNNNDYNIIVNNESLKIFDLKGNKLNDNYKWDLKIERPETSRYIDTYYDKKLCKSYIFFDYLDTLSVIDYQTGKIYQTLPEIYYNYEDIIINDDNENLIKVIYIINRGSIGIFNFHSGQLLYKINITIIPIKNCFDIFEEDNIYSLNFWNENYASLSYGKIIEVGFIHQGRGRRSTFVKKYHSIEIINLKEEKMKQVLQLTTVNKSIFVKKLFHPKYGDCLLTQDNCGEIKIIQIKI